MFRSLLLLCLTATLAGPFLRAWEGADDLARSLAELGQPALMEEVDGGVGDDAGAAVLAARRQKTCACEPSESTDPRSANDCLPCGLIRLPHSAAPIEWSEPIRHARRVGTRLALIGRFLI